MKKINLIKAIEERDRLIAHLAKVNGGVALCQSCAEKLIENGANPPPFPISAQRILPQQTGATPV